MKRKREEKGLVLKKKNRKAWYKKEKIERPGIKKRRERTVIGKKK